MSDYTKTVDFAAKDALPTGNAGKVAKGTEVDTEFDNIAIAVATKFDSTDAGAANGLATLDGSSLVPSAQLPTANTTTVGALETSTSAEAIALSATDKIIVPSVLGAGVGAWGDLNAGMLSDIQALADPAADTVLGWDDSASAAIAFTLGTGLNSNLTALEVTQSDILLTGLGDYDANKVIDHSTITFTAGTGLTGGGTLAGNRTFDLDISGLTTIEVNSTVSTDSVLINDGGTMKQMEFKDMGIRVVERTADITALAHSASQTMQLLTGATGRTFGIPTNAVTPFAIGSIIYFGSRDTAELTLSPTTSGVRLTSAIRSDVGPTAGNHTVASGGIAAAVKVATNEWLITGDIS